MAFYLQRRSPSSAQDAEELTSNYLIRHYAQFATNPARRSSRCRTSSVAQSRTSRVYVVRATDAQRRALLESRGWRVIAEGRIIVRVREIADESAAAPSYEFA